jgi:hypothetical protein
MIENIVGKKPQWTSITVIKLDGDLKKSRIQVE